RNRWGRAELPGLGDTEERIRDRLPQLRRVPATAERKHLTRQRRVDLIDVDQRVGRTAVSDVTAGGADVADRDRHRPGQLPLDVGGILMHPGRSLVLIHEIDAAANVRQQPERAADWGLQPSRERIVQNRDWHLALWCRLSERRR